ncbi:MAG: AI-2E family transporter [Casimicrobiaceae bacterium]
MARRAAASTADTVTPPPVVAVVAPAELPPAKYSALEMATIAIAVVAVIAAARIAEPFLVPVVLGILLSYTLRPLVTALERIRLPRSAAAGVVVVTVLFLLGFTGWGLRDNVNAAVAELPAAARKLRQMAAESASDSQSTMTHVKAAAAELDRAAAEATGKVGAPVAAPPPTAVVAPQLQGFLATQGTRIATVIGELLVAFLLAFFLLLSGDTFRRKLARLAGASLARRRITVEALNEIDTQIQNYMLTLLIANLLIAAVTWGGLSLLGVANSGMWGAIVGVLHIIPYAGTVIAAVLVGFATLLDTDSVSTALAAVGIILAIAAVIGIGLTTWMQGRACRLNVVATFIGILFFGWLWGGWGLLLGLPLLAVLKSIADRVEAMQPVRELLSP